ncbi:MAG: GIY-YIG nuclease family protein [Deltaproteobacteria bacterium]|nr:GIY-YIG nuclease family protein [Deltaproteobacteria bacterium]MBW1738132.1 GIY-YIG nuclease family protein [Deltaproteobacteria bacterium]MBW1908537.1 GIY-YIG nuclease family protein [Deltaproteobacteria bacterium]MBW2114832.1 GIY-YIG nuclease family protein [Deltaproteobacteria bacterium]MBW2168752.1 GIY-YIG nuclease family protein [Deltaproteobacteria bacterium]
MYYVYLLKDPNSESIYIGYTSNLRKRTKEHKEGKKFWKTTLFGAGFYGCL